MKIDSNITTGIIIFLSLVVIFISSFSKHYFRVQERQFIAEHTTNEQFYNYLIIRSITGFIIIMVVIYVIHKQK
jgi:hypothetical protein